MSIDFRQLRHHSIPNLALDIHGRIGELHLVKKTALECFVQILGKVCTYIPASIHNEAMLSGAWTSIAQ